MTKQEAYHRIERVIAAMPEPNIDAIEEGIYRQAIGRIKEILSDVPPEEKYVRSVN